MKLTSDWLQQQGACGEGLQYFEANFPNGTTLLDILNRKDIPTSYVYWGVLAIGFSNDPIIAEKEVAAYNACLHLDNSTSVFQSSRVRDSHMVSNSHIVNASQYIYSSDKVKHSANVCSSSVVEDSDGIYNSKFVYGSKEILYSTNITGSENVINTNYAVSCNNVMDSNLTTRVKDSRKCRNVNDSAFCINVEDSSDCLFCCGTKGRQYIIFNQPVTAELFGFIMKQYESIMPKHLTYAEPYIKNAAIHQVPKVYYDIRKYYVSIMEDETAMEWIKSLPNFNANLWYNMTFCPIP